MLTRRRFIQSGSLAMSGILLPRGLSLGTRPALESYVRAKMSEFHIPGMAISLVRNNKIHWIKGFGWADIENEVPMDPIRSIQNIGSISKTITATAIMQLWENNLFSLDDDVNDHLDIRIRNPHYPDVPITFRQLLAHRSSIMDGDSYGQSYRCGDPAVSLSSWIRDYFTPGGQFYDADGNFHHWKPGREDPLPEFPRSYSNVGFGLLGYLVEVLSGERFETYTRKHIFEPLEMMDTAWFIKDIETDRHATPYTYMSEDMELPPGFSYEMALPKYAEEVTPIQTGAYFPHCLYSFYNYPDGLLRTTAHDLSHFMICYLQGGLFHDRRILEKHTINKMYQPPYQAEITRGLCWDITGINDRRFIGHGGGDPGINTLMYFDPDASEGMLILTNSSAANLREMMAYLLKEIE